MPSDVTQIAAVCTAIFTGIFAGIAVYDYRKRPRLKLVAYGKQPASLGRQISVNGIEYFAIVKNEGSRITGCEGSLIFKGNHYHSYLYPVMGERIDTSGHDVEGLVLGLTGLPLFAVGGTGTSKITIPSESWEALKYEKMKFNISSVNATDLSREVTIDKIMAKAEELPLIMKRVTGKEKKK